MNNSEELNTMDIVRIERIEALEDKLRAYENLDEINAGLMDALKLIMVEAQEGLWPEESLTYIAVTAKAALKKGWGL